MTISIIVAISENYVIGDKNQLLWHLPTDMKHFKEITTGKTVVMGRKTFESIGKPLPNRQNVIITQDKEYSAKGCNVTHSIEETLNFLKDKDEIFIIGGALLYAQMLPKADKLYLTIVHKDFDGDAHFPEIDFSQWEETNHEDHQPDEKNPYPYSFITSERKR
ncbi:MAG: dihydrofolate reductase [Candidatus Berkelbacteria bacterium]|nr:dihydrofolate reductase [Candidatus Berkelbacteria bacterium]